jgi:hypothetical protein
MSKNSGDFFDAFDDGISVDWSKISEADLDIMLQKLSKQDVEKIFTDLQAAIASNNKKKAIVNITLRVLDMAVRLGMKVA